MPTAASCVSKDARSGTSAGQGIDGHGRQQDQARGNQLPLQLEAQHEHAVVDSTDHEATQKAVDGATTATEEVAEEIPPMTAAATA